MFGLDVSTAMLEVAREVFGTPPVRGDAAHLPFADASFDAVVSCRLLHHLPQVEQLEAVVAELTRVSRGLVLASFWDADTLGGWRRRFLPSARHRRSLRSFHRRATLRHAFEHAGARVLAFDVDLRFLTRQTFVVARRTP